MKRISMIKLRGNRSQKEIAERLGISQQHYSNIEFYLLNSINDFEFEYKTY